MRLATILATNHKRGVMKREFLTGNQSLVLVSVLALGAGLWLFFDPAFSIPHVDDLFFIPWAGELAASGHHRNALLREQFPQLQELYLQTRLHMIFSGLFFKVTELSRTSVVGYEALCYVVSSLFFIAYALSRQMRLAALFAPLLFALMYALSGFRLEVTGVALWVAGLVLLYGPLARQQEKPDGSGKLLQEITGKLMLAMAALAAPSILAWSLGAILAHDIQRLVEDRRTLGRLFVVDMIAFALVVLIFLLSIDFELSIFLEQFFFHTSRTPWGGINREALARGLGFALLAWFWLRNKEKGARLLVALAAGQLLTLGLHDKSLIRNMVTVMIFLVVIEGSWLKPWRAYVYGLAVVVFLALSGNLFLFKFLGSSQTLHISSVQADYRADLAKGRKVAIDEAMAHHVLDHKTKGALSWTWRNRFPLARPQSLDELGPDDVWYVSKYTLFGYLRGRHPIARELAQNGVTYQHAPQMGCWLGRSSCNLPRQGWGLVRLARVRTGGKGFLITDYDRDKKIITLK